MRNLDAHFSCQDASLVLQFFYGLQVACMWSVLACHFTEHIRSRCENFICCWLLAMIRPLLVVVRNLAAKVPEAAGESICYFAAGLRGALYGSKLALT